MSGYESIKRATAPLQVDDFFVSQVAPQTKAAPGDGWFDDFGDHEVRAHTLARLTQYLNRIHVPFDISGDIIALGHCPIKGPGNHRGGPRIYLHPDGSFDFDCFHTPCKEGGWSAVEAKFGPLPPGPLSLPSAPTSQSTFEIVNAADLLALPPVTRRVVVDGLLRRGDVASFVGGPKTRKSFLLMQLALCVASGTPFLGHETMQGTVLLVDNELRLDDLSSRLRRMIQAMRLAGDVIRHIDIMSLRGKLADLYTIRNELCGLPREKYQLIVIDAFYKCLAADVDENSNSSMTQMLVLLDEIAETQNCTTAFVHHTSKGSQANKKVSDVGAGAGAQSRSVDAHIVLREHEEKDTIVMDGILRSQPPIAPVCLEFQYPLWQLARDKDPEAIKASNQKPIPTLEEFIRTVPVELSRMEETLERSRRTLLCSKKSLKALVMAAEDRGLIEVVKPQNKRQPHMIRRIEKGVA